MCCNLAKFLVQDGNKDTSELILSYENFNGYFHVISFFIGTALLAIHSSLRLLHTA
jgi:hypothetical protein